MNLAILVVTAAQLLDLGTFFRMIGVRGPVAEINPLVGTLLDGQGLPFVAVAKIAALALVVAVLVVLGSSGDRPGHPRLVAAIAFVAIIAGLVGGWTNAGAIVPGIL